MLNAKIKLYNFPVTLAKGSFDLIALNAENEAVPPPIKRYGTCFGKSDDFIFFLDRAGSEQGTFFSTGASSSTQISSSEDLAKLPDNSQN